MDELKLGPEEVAELEDAIEKMTGPQLIETIDDLARREIELIKNPHIRDDEEMREITRWNIAALIAASIRLSPGQTGPQETQTSPEPQESPPTPE